MIRKIVSFPNDILMRPAAPITEFSAALRELAADMIATMEAAHGCGLAAPQIGVSQRIFIVDPSLEGAPVGAPRVFVNSAIVEVGKETQVEREGCLSFNKIFVPIARPTRVILRAANVDGMDFTVEGRGMWARAILHEHDHTQGVVMTAHASSVWRERIWKTLKR